MFQSLFKRAERSIDEVVARAAIRALVAVPFLIAAGFATAALTVMLVETYGAITGYGLMAALFGVIGLVAVAIVGMNAKSAPSDESSDQKSATDNAGSSEDQASPDIGDLLTPEVRALLTSAMPVAAPGLLRGVGRNLPLIFILAVVAFVISQFAGRSGTEPDEEAAADADPVVADAPAPAPSTAAAA